VSPLLAATLLALVHVGEGLLWFAVIILAVGRASHLLVRPAVKRWLDRVTGVIFIALGARLAVEGLRR
jgi:threonine/homoserine/homoserine lactone efflux protein